MEFNIGEIYNGIKRSIKTSNFLIWIIIIISSFMLFAPIKYIELLYLEPVRDNYNWIFGLLFLVSITILVIKFLYNIYYFIYRIVNTKN